MSAWETFTEYIKQQPNLAFRPYMKDEYKKKGRAALREIALALQNTGEVKSIKLHYNSGGPAVSGDFHLKGDYLSGGSFDLFFSYQGGTEEWIYYRMTENQKDYLGGTNNLVSLTADKDVIIERILMLGKKKYTA